MKEPERLPSLRISCARRAFCRRERCARLGSWDWKNSSALCRLCLTKPCRLPLLPLPQSQDEKVKALEALVEEAKELREAERDHLAEKSLDELGEMEVRRPSGYSTAAPIGCYSAVLLIKFPVTRCCCCTSVPLHCRMSMPTAAPWKRTGGGASSSCA